MESRVRVESGHAQSANASEDNRQSPRPSRAGKQDRYLPDAQPGQHANAEDNPRGRQPVPRPTTESCLQAVGAVLQYGETPALSVFWPISSEEEHPPVERKAGVSESLWVAVKK